MNTNDPNDLPAQEPEPQSFLLRAQVSVVAMDVFEAREVLGKWLLEEPRIEAAEIESAVTEPLAFVWYQRLELGRAREKHSSLSSLHAAYAVILEELDEFWDQVKLQEPQRDVPKMVQELTQIAAMCQRTFEDLKLNERYRPQ